MTGAEVLRLLAELHGSVDAAYRDELAERFILAAGRRATGISGVAFLLVGTMLALVPASQIGAAWSEESSGRLRMVLPGPRGSVGSPAPGAGRRRAGRVRPARGRRCVAGGTSQGLDLDGRRLLAAGVNMVPTAFAALAFGAVLLAWRPRLAVPGVYAVVAWSLVADLWASLVPATAWLPRTSLFHYVTLVPGGDPDWRSLAVTTLLAVTAAGAAIAGSARRDLRGH